MPCAASQSFGVVIAGLYAAFLTDNLNPRIDFSISHLLLVLVLASVTFVAARFAAGTVAHYGGGVEKRLLSASLFASIAQITVITFGVLIISELAGHRDHAAADGPWGGRLSDRVSR